MSTPSESTHIPPRRIQLKRTKGWRIRQAHSVARPTRWGNPFTVAGAIENEFVTSNDSLTKQRRFVVGCFHSWLTEGENSLWWFESGRQQHQWIVANLHVLRGRDLACWCPLSDPCHADVLIEFANA